MIFLSKGKAMFDALAIAYLKSALDDGAATIAATIKTMKEESSLEDVPLTDAEISNVMMAVLRLGMQVIEQEPEKVQEKPLKVVPTVTPLPTAAELQKQVDAAKLVEDEDEGAEISIFNAPTTISTIKPSEWPVRTLKDSAEGIHPDPQKRYAMKRVQTGEVGNFDDLYNPKPTFNEKFGVSAERARELIQAPEVPALDLVKQFNPDLLLTPEQVKEKQRQDDLEAARKFVSEPQYENFGPSKPALSEVFKGKLDIPAQPLSDWAGYRGDEQISKSEPVGTVGDFSDLYQDKRLQQPAPSVRHGFTPSKYQQAIFDWVQNGTGHAVVNAVAGSGKTTTVVEASKYMRGRCLFLAFNKHIATELQGRLGPNFEASTFNAFGWGICRKNARTKLNAFKDDQILRQFMGITGRNMRSEEGKRYKRIKTPLLRLVGLLKSTMERFENWRQLATDYGVDLTNVKPNDDLELYLKRVFEESVGDVREMSFDDQIYQPIANNWDLPKYDWVVIDEGQDASPVQIEMARRLAKHGRVVIVGDPDQSIYLFRGAHPDALSTVADDLGAVELPLSVCYRCPDAVIEAARQEVPRIEAPVPNPKGEGLVEWTNTPDFENQVAVGDMVLCRTVAPLIKRCLRQWAKGKKATVKGRDISESLTDLIDEIDRGQDYYDFLAELGNFVNQKKERLENFGREDEAGNLEDRYEGITFIAQDGCNSIADIRAKIERLFSDDKEKTDGIQFMTGHKSKGLESKQPVWIIRPDLMPHKRAKTEAQLRQERNLSYVMKTRAMSALYFVEKEKDEK